MVPMSDTTNPFPRHPEARALAHPYLVVRALALAVVEPQVRRCLIVRGHVLILTALVVVVLIVVLGRKTSRRHGQCPAR
jgi:hypothetical protein